jgi:metal-dependent amidase/aminoacylase/carboxypeptidase family protein
VMAGEFIVQLQTIVSRQEDPRDPAIVTIGVIHGGTKRNIIPNEVKMEITARAYSDKSRQIILDGIRRTAQGVALSAGVPDDLAPLVTVLDAESTPVMYNDPALTARVKAALIKALGSNNVSDEQPGTASEDFGVFGLEGRKIPTVMFGLGAMDPVKFSAARAEGRLLPGPHNSRFEPLPEPTLRTGVKAMTSVAIALLQK